MILLSMGEMYFTSERWGVFQGTNVTSSAGETHCITDVQDPYVEILCMFRLLYVFLQDEGEID